MLKLENIRKVFHPGTVNQKIALDGLSLTLNDGDFVTVIGGNGAGKSPGPSRWIRAAFPSTGRILPIFRRKSGHGFSAVFFRTR